MKNVLGNREIDVQEFDHKYLIYPPPSYPPILEGEEINLLDYWRVLTKRKWQILSTILICFAVTLALSLLLPKKYKAEVTLMPISNSNSNGLSSILGQFDAVPMLGDQLGGLAGSLGGSKALEIAVILKSRTLSKNIVEKFDLMRVFFKHSFDSTSGTYKKGWFGFGTAPLPEDAVKYFQKKVAKIKEDKKTGMIQISIELKDPQLAAEVANSMVVALQDFISNNTLTVEKRNRIFIEQQLIKNGAKFLEAGKSLNTFYSQNRISSIIPEADVSVGSYEDVPATFADFRDNLKTISGQQAEMEHKIQNAQVAKVPEQIYLEYLTLNKNLMIKVHALLMQQYEMSKIEEVKEDLAFQVIDKAFIKKRHDSPKLLLNLVIGTVLGFFLGVLLAFFLEYLKTLKEKQDSSGKGA